MLAARPRGLIGELAQQRQAIFEAHLAGAPGGVIVGRCTNWVEGVIKRLYREALARQNRYAPVGLVAVGGFGRGELNLYSDVDLLFLYPQQLKGEMEKLAEQVLYPLWDLKLDVGHAARTMEDCLLLAGQDFSVLVSLLTARTIAGSAEPVGQLGQRLAASLKDRQARQEFLAKVQAADEERRRKFGHTPNLLEPNVKESEGGLRDIHTLTWLGLGCFQARNLGQLLEQGLITDPEVSLMGQAREFLWRVRNHLHYLAQGHDDQLTFARQAKVAEFLGYRDKDGLPAVELFMRDYYTWAHGLRNIRSLVFERVQAALALGSPRTRLVEEDLVVEGDRLGLLDPAKVKSRPGLLMRLFAASARSGVRVAHRARQQVRDHRYLVDQAFRLDPEIRREFFTVLLPPHPEALALWTLYSSGLLHAYLPELNQVFQLPQHDAFHIYTVDVHQVHTVEQLARLKAGPPESEAERLAQELSGQISRPRLLYLAALLHDVGKVGGKGHAERGAQIVEPALERLGLKEEERDLVRFLIANHLLLMDVALRRDVHDERLLFRLAGQVGDEERLAMLYLLTVADSLATGPRAWSTWQAALLTELYFLILAILQRPDVDSLATPEQLAQLKETVAKLLAGKVSPERVDRLVEELPPQQLLSTPSPAIAEQLLLQERLSGKPAVVDVKEKAEAGYCEFTVATKRRRGLFSRVAGVMTLNGLNILGAQIFHRRDNVSLFVIQVEFPSDPLGRARKWQAVEASLERALTGRLALELRINQRRKQMNRGLRLGPHRPALVKVDNDISDFHTVVEVTADDRLGLLYDLTRVFQDLDLEIHLAKISTKVDQVMDVFYVTDLDGAKAEDPDQIKEIKEALTALLD